MEIDEWAIGQRIAAHRARRGLTQAELAGLVGISLSMMKKIESGDRLVTRFSQLIHFAQALKIRDLRELTGVPLTVAPPGRHTHPSVDAVHSALMARTRSGNQPPHLDALAQDIERAWQSWQQPSAFRYNAVGAQLPGLIDRTQAAVRQATEHDRRRTLRLASTLYQLTRTWTKRVGEYELSLLAADRAVACALDADDPDMAAAAAWNLAMILSAQGKVGHAREVIRQAIDDLTPRLAQPSAARLAVFGGLHLLGATVAAQQDDRSEVGRLLEVAARVAAKTGETNHFRMVFGPTNVALHRMSTTIDLGRVGEALAVAEQLPIDRAPAVERRLTFHLDAARCYVLARNDVAAIHMLQRMHRESPEEFRYSSVARETLRHIKARAKPALETDLRPLVAAANLTD
ncbi:helix-turn-helix domain-containing protein [Allorhizocola rhizosphaerae]|uniref:helix-turn-helix domain-containing protein n=1 Tax=Allorhizocola rhizosphaerae TaxID=1872709 RepID=UPI000E3E5728|nr:helix-turn-helix transcriptional regulator [Allorhizocola rhizosphaerae]